jgi:starch phosphorylase
MEHPPRHATVTVQFAGQTVRAVAYDMPISATARTISARQAVAERGHRGFDFQPSTSSSTRCPCAKERCGGFTRVLYPNDSTYAGKQLRLKQQYFLSSASLQDILFNFKRAHGDLSKLADMVAIQLNDTHPVVSIPELIRLLRAEGWSFDDALSATKRIFSYTNHTVMAEAMEKWDVELFKSVLPDVFDIIYRINERFCGELMQRGCPCIHEVSIIQGPVLHMANLASYCSRTINGVAALHPEILKKAVLKHFYELFPERFQNKTNASRSAAGSSCATGAFRLYHERVGEGWIYDLDVLKGLKPIWRTRTSMRSTPSSIRRRSSFRVRRKAEGGLQPPDFLFDVQVKRMHEYKRQILNAFSILDLYFGLKDGTIKDFTPTAFLFGAKAAPGYWRAKAVIKFIHEVAYLVNNDPPYRISYAWCSWPTTTSPLPSASSPRRT